MIIEVKKLSKEFKVFERKQGFFSTLRNLIDYNYKIVRAVDNIDFTIKRGDMVGFIGPNGAGKSTTVKMLCGILVPTDGEITVNGFTPHKSRKKIAKSIGVVFGQKTQLLWDLPAIESFDLLRDIYDIPKETYKKNMEMFNDMLGIDEFVNRPVRQLSLGQRMKADIAASLLHDPEIIYFDEPTIGLDVVAKENIREFIRKLNREKGTTILFTTHDMDDIEKTCNRIIIIDRGNIIYDGGIADIKRHLKTEKVITVQFEEYIKNVVFEDIQAIDGPENKKMFKLEDNAIRIKELINFVFANYKVKDILISEPDIEDLIRKIYKKEFDINNLKSVEMMKI